MNDDLNIYEILEAVRKRPAMYFGSSDFHELHELQAFIAGLTLDRWKTSEKPPFREFGNWIVARFNWSTTAPFYELEKKFGSDNVFEKYFELLDEYKVCRETCLEKALILETHKPTFYKIPPEDIYGRIEPEKPLLICVGQYAPSNVYYLFEIYPDRFEKHFPYQNSVEKVKEHAKRRWSVEINEWVKI